MPNSNQKSRVLHNYLLPSVFLLEFYGQHQNNEELFHDSDRIPVRKVAGEFPWICLLPKKQSKQTIKTSFTLEFLNRHISSLVLFLTFLVSFHNCFLKIFLVFFFPKGYIPSMLKTNKQLFCPGTMETLLTTVA